MDARWRALSALAIGYFLILLDQGLMPVVTPRLPAGATDAVWLTSIYLLWTVVPMPVTGRLGDRYGQRPVYLAGIVLYAAGLALAAASWSWPVLVVARAVQGLGSAVFLPQAFGLINRIFPADGRGKAFAAWGVAGSVGSLLGPVIGGVLVDASGWRSAFALQSCIAVIGAVCAVIWLPHLPSAPTQIRIGPVILSFVGLTLLVSGIQSLSGWRILFGAVLFSGLVAAERELFRDRNFTLGTAAIAMMGFAVASMFIPVMFWLLRVAGVSAATAGLLTAPMSVVAMVLTPVAGAAVDNPGRFSAKALSVFGFTVMAGGLVAGWAVAATAANPLWFGLVSAVLGVGSAFVWAPNAAITMRGVPDATAGAASGLYNTLRQVGSVVGVAAVGAVMGLGGVEVASISAMLVPAAAMIAGAVLSALLRADIPAQSR